MDFLTEENRATLDKENIIFTVKYSLEHSNYTEKLEKLAEVSQQKNEEIKALCRNNQSNLLENLEQFSDINHDITSTHDKIKSFESQLLNLIKMNIYNSTKAANLSESKKNIDGVIEILRDFSVCKREIVLSLQKAVDNVKGDNFMACLRILNSLKKKNILSHPAGPSIRKLFGQLLPLITGKIRGYINNELTDDMMNEWMRYMKNKKAEYAQFLVNQIEDTGRKKRFSTQGGGRDSLFSDYKIRSSMFRGRDSVMSRLSIGPTGSDNGRNSTQPNPMIERKSTQYFGMDNKFIKTGKYQDYTKKELSHDLKIDYYLFNQCKQIFENLNELPALYEQIKELRRNQMLQIFEAKQLIEPAETKAFMANILGFFMVQKELERQIPQIQDMNQLWLDAGKSLETELDKTFDSIQTPQDYFLVKTDLQVFTIILSKFGFSSQAILLTDILKGNYIKFSEKLIKDAISTIHKKMLQDKCDPLVVRNPSQLKEYVLNYEIDKSLNLQLYHETKNIFPIYLSYSIIIPEICSTVVQFINDNVQFMQGTLDNESFLFLQLDRLLFEVYKLYYDELEKNLNMYTPLQLGEIYQNANVLETLSHFFKKHLEKASTYKYLSELESNSYCEQIEYLCDEQICEKIKTKLKGFLSVYTEISWAPGNKNNKYTDVIEDVINYLTSVLLTMKTILPSNVANIAFVAFRYLNDTIMGILCTQVKSFNIVGFANLDLDMIQVFNFCSTVLQEFDGLRDCLKEVRQLLDLFMVGPINEFMDLRTRKTKYYCLDPKKLIPIMEKYKKVIVQGLPELRKRDVDAVLKDLKKELKKQ